MFNESFPFKFFGLFISLDSDITLSPAGDNLYFCKEDYLIHRFNEERICIISVM